MAALTRHVFFYHFVLRPTNLGFDNNFTVNFQHFPNDLFSRDSPSTVNTRVTVDVYDINHTRESFFFRPAYIKFSYAERKKKPPLRLRKKRWNPRRSPWPLKGKQLYFWINSANWIMRKNSPMNLLLEGCWSRERAHVYLFSCFVLHCVLHHWYIPT